MQDWPTDSSNPFRDHAQMPGGPPRRSSPWVTVLLILGGCLLLLLVPVGGFLFWGLHHGAASTPLAPRETLEQKTTASRQAYASDEIGCDDTTLPPIKRLLGQLERAARSNDDAAFRRLVSMQHLIACVKQSEAAQGMGAWDLLVLRLDGALKASVDPAWQRITLRYVQQLEGTGQYVLYTHCYGPEDGETDVRFWVVNDGGTWMLADWERLDLGLRQSTEWALYLAYAEDARLEEYIEAMVSVQRAAEHNTAGNESLAREALERAATQRVPPELRDSVWVVIGYEWNRLSDAAAAIRCFERVENPEATPGVFFGTALALADMGRYAEAVETMSRYEHYVGCAPEACRFQANWLVQLGRPAEAAEQWKKVLRGMPDDHYALHSLARLLEPDHLDGLKVYLSRVGDPQTTAEELADLFFQQRNGKGLEVIEGFAAESSPGSGTAEYVGGLVAYNAARLEQSATRFRRSLDLVGNEQQKVQRRQRFLDVMLESDQVLSAYRAVDDQPAAIAYLLGDYPDSGVALTLPEIDALIAEHRGAHPEDPRGHYLAGLRLAEEGRHEEAVDALTRAWDLPSEDYALRDAIRFALDKSLIHCGKWEVAYAATEPSADRLAAVAACLHELKLWDSLRALLEQHGSTYLDDPRTLYYRAALCVQEEDYDTVQTLLADLDQLDETQGIDHLVRYDIDFLAAHPRLWQAVYQRVEDPARAGSLFRRWAPLFRTEARFEELQSLIALHRARFPHDLLAVSWQSRLLVTDEERARYADTYFPRREELFEEAADSWRGNSPAEDLVRVLLQLRRPAEALEVAELAQEKKQEIVPLILCHVSELRVAEAEATIEQYLAEDGAMYALYDDATAGALLRSSSFAQLQSQHPLQLPYTLADHETVMLWEQMPQWDAAQLQVQLASMGDNVQVVAIEDHSPSAEPRWVVQLGAARLLVAVHDGKCRRVRSPSSGSASESITAALEGHAAWVSVSGVRWALPDGADDCHGAVRDIVQRLANEQCLAFWFVDYQRLLPSDVEQMREWASAPHRLAIAQLGVPGELKVEGVASDVEAQRALTRTMRQLLNAFRQTAAQGQFVLGADLHVGYAHERLWLALESTPDDGRYVGCLQQDSLLVPALSAGQRLCIDDYDLAACRFDEAGETVEAAVPHQH